MVAPTPPETDRPRRWRWRWWIAALAGALVLVVAVVVVLVVTTGGPSDITPLKRLVTGQYDGPKPGPKDLVLPAVDDDTGYFGYQFGGEVYVAAYRAGSGKPAWAVRAGRQVEEMQQLAVLDGVVLVALKCPGTCVGMIGIDARTGSQLWTSPLPGGGVIGSAGGYAAVQLLDAQGFADGAVGVELRTGRVAWESRQTGNYDRYTMAKGSDRVVHYAQRGSLELIDIRTGQPTATASIPGPPSGQTDVWLTTSGDLIALSLTRGGSTTGAVFSGTDLARRWERAGRINTLAPGRLYVAGSGGRQVVDANGTELWRPKDEVGYLAANGSWGLVRTYLGSGAGSTEQFEYVDLTTGRHLAGDARAPAWGEPEGVIQVQNRSLTSSAHLRYLKLPSGRAVDLGTQPLNWVSCTFSHTRIACVDADGLPGIWSYRPQHA